MRFLKNVFSQLHRWVLWALLSAIFWGWIFGFVTDTSPAKKVTLYAQVPACEDKALALALEAEKPEQIRMVKVHPFSYALFDAEELATADLYIVCASQVEQFLDDFAPLDSEAIDLEGRELYTARGRAYGIKVYDAASGTGAALDYLHYAEGEDCYLFFNASSPHLTAGDGAALQIARALLDLD